MTEEHKFQVNLQGVIDLLSDHLYSGPQVYLRELLQNGVDAIVARRHVEPTHTGEIRLEIIPAKEDRPATLAIYDSGIGLNEAEVHRFLATIGQSSKRESLSRADFIGQFGIGLLSGFVVSEEIVVVTRSVTPGSPTLEWRGRADGTYSIRTLQVESEPGTQVYLRAKPGSQEYFEPEFVRQTATHFGNFLPIPITVVAGKQQWQINETPPWLQEDSSPEARRERLLDYGRETFDTDFLDAIPLNSAAGGVAGVAFILPQAAAINSRHKHRVYLKNMLLSEAADNLLPEWAFFVRCVVNATQLRPTAARESFYEDTRLETTREELGTCLKQYLIELSRHQRKRLNQIIDCHYLAIKSLAVEDDEFYKLFIDWLPFETTLGTMTLGEYLQREKIIQYVPSRDQFRQIAGVAAAQGMCIINSGYTYDTDLLEKLPQVFAKRKVQRVEVSDLTQQFGELTLDERAEVFDFLRLADVILQPFRCTADIRRFDPAGLPTLYTSNDASNFLRSVEQSKDVSDDLWSGVLDGISQEPAAGAYAQLCLNLNNPLVQKLARVRGRLIIRRAVEMLYVQALLLGHYPLQAKEMKLLSEGLLGLIEIGLGTDQPEGNG